MKHAATISGSPGATMRDGNMDATRRKSRFDGLSSHSFGTAQPVDVLMEAAEIETRLRAHMLELIEPTISKQRQQENALKTMNRTLDTMSDDVRDLRHALDGQETYRGQVETFRAELADTERQRRQHEQEVSEKVALQEIQMNELRQTMERKTSDMASVNRALKGMAESFQNANQEMSELRRYCIERLDLARDKLAKLRDEFETRMHTIESQHFGLRDNLMGLDTTISHIKSESEITRNDVEEAKQGVVDLWRSKVNVHLVEQQQQEFSEFARRVDALVSGLGEQFEGLVVDVKAHMQTASDVVGNTTAQQIQEMRDKYKEEAKRADAVLLELGSFPTKQRELEEKLLTGIERVEGEAKAEREQIRDVFQHQLKRAENNHNELAIDLRQLRRTVKDMESNAGGNGFGGGAIGTDILSMIVESNLLGASLEMQDDLDRKNIALFGYKPGSEDGSHSGTASHRVSSRGGGCKLPDLNGSQSARGTGTGNHAFTPRRRLAPSEGESSPEKAKAHPADPIITLDKRCLSCSGSQATILAGFKLACLQYAPSPVEYQKVTYSRSELIRLRIDLLNQVKEQLRSVE